MKTSEENYIKRNMSMFELVRHSHPVFLVQGSVTRHDSEYFEVASLLICCKYQTCGKKSMHT